MALSDEKPEQPTGQRRKGTSRRKFLVRGGAATGAALAGLYLKPSLRSVFASPAYAAGTSPTPNPPPSQPPPPPLEPNCLFVDESNGGVLTLEVPGFSLTILPGSATFPDGGKSGVVCVTVVHNDKIPLVPNFGQQPRFIVTIEPAGVLFNPPAPITIPNVEGLAPGEVTEMYSFDHDLGQFVSIGTGTVSQDGTIIASDPGVGIIKGG